MIFFLHYVLLVQYWEGILITLGRNHIFSKFKGRHGASLVLFQNVNFQVSTPSWRGARLVRVLPPSAGGKNSCISPQKSGARAQTRPQMFQIAANIFTRKEARFQVVWCFRSFIMDFSMELQQLFFSLTLDLVIVTLHHNPSRVRPTLSEP